MTGRAGISRGLNIMLRSLQPTSIVNEAEQGHTTFTYIQLKFLQPGKFQPRHVFNQEQLQGLAESIVAQGVIQPLIVRKYNEDSYEIIAGERRWRAAKLAGLTQVPVIIQNITDDTALALALIENIQREDLNPIDQALALARLRDEFLMTHEKIANTVGRSRSAVTNLMRLLTLGTEVKLLLQEGKLELGHAKALLSLDEQDQVIIAHQIAERGLTVRQAESLIRKTKALPAEKDLNDPTLALNTKRWSEILSRKVSSTVKVQLNNKGEGRVVIQVGSPEEVEWLINHINSDE